MGSILNLFSNKFNPLRLVQKHQCINCIMLYSSATVPLMYRLCHSIGVTSSAFKTGDMVTGCSYQIQTLHITAYSYRGIVGTNGYFSPQFSASRTTFIHTIIRNIFFKYCTVVIYLEMTHVTIVSWCDTTEYGSASCVIFLSFVSLSHSHPIPHPKTK